MNRIIFLGASLLVFSATSAFSQNNQKPMEFFENMYDQPWQLTKLNGEPPIQAMGGSTPFFQFTKEGRYAAKVGCNNMMGQYTMEGDSLRFGSGAGTMMACPLEFMEQDKKVSDMLSKVTNFNFREQYLQLIADGEVLAELKPMPRDFTEFTNTRWVLRTFKGKPIERPENNREAFLQFREDGFRAQKFCNQIRGGYTKEGHQLSLKAGPMTRMACPHPLEGDWLRAIAEVDSYEIFGEELRLQKGRQVIAVYQAIYY